MIVRRWRAEASPEGALAYKVHAQTSVIPDLRMVEGYLGHLMTERQVGRAVEIVVLTFWRDLDCIRTFSGADIERAVVDPAAHEAVLSYDEYVEHADTWATSILADR